MTALTRLVAMFDRFRRDDDGQGLAEYALILALIAIVAIVALIFMGSQVSDKLSIIGSQLESVPVTGLDPTLAGQDRSPPDPSGPAGSSYSGHLAGNLAIRADSCRFLPMVLAHWYSRAPLPPVLQWCHLSHASGRKNLKRSNRLVLLVGVFLAVVAFVGILLLSNGAGGGQTEAPTDGPVVVATTDIPLSTRIRADQVTTKTIAADVHHGRRLHRPVAGHRQDRARAGHVGRADHLDDPQRWRGRCHHRHPGPARAARDRRPGRPGHGRRHGHPDRRLRRHGGRLHRATSSRSSR